MTRRSRAWRFVRARYLSVDPRTAGVFRIVLGALLSLDCIRHWSEASLLYSAYGVFPNDKHLWRPTSGHLFSLLHAFSTEPEVHLVFALGFACHLLLLVGYRARLFAFLSFVFVTSRDSRIPLVENGGYVVVNLVTLYAWLLPIGQRLSVDAWIRSWRARKETTATELNDRDPIRGPTAPVVTFAAGLALANFAAIYFFNVVNKTGQIWRQGHTVQYVLHVDRMVTGLAVFCRDHLPFGALMAAGYSVLAVEAFILVNILSPRGRKHARIVAMALVFGLHATFGMMMRLGPFSWFMIGWSTLLLLPVHWGVLRRWHERRAPVTEVAIDEGSALAVAIGRVVARLDPYARLRFVPGAPAGALLAVRRGDAAAMVVESRAVSSGLLAATPLGRAPPFRWLAAPLARVVDGMRRHEVGVTRWLGLSTKARPPAPPPAPILRPLARAAGIVRELLLVGLGASFAFQAWLENKAIPQQLPPPVKEGQVLTPDEVRGLGLTRRVMGDRVIQLKPTSPAFHQALITYPRLFQGWGMFAPNPIQEDGVLAIDAYTVDGRRIDPLTGRAPDLDLTDSRGEGLSQLRQDYGNRIRLDRNAIHRDGLREYLMRYHLQTGDPSDEIVAFDVYWVRDRCPKPGQARPSHGDAVPISTWRKPGYTRPQDLPPIPPTPRVRSAEKWDDVKPEPAPQTASK